MPVAWVTTGYWIHAKTFPSELPTLDNNFISVKIITPIHLRLFYLFDFGFCDRRHVMGVHLQPFKSPVETLYLTLLHQYLHLYSTGKSYKILCSSFLISSHLYHIRSSVTNVIGHKVSIEDVGYVDAPQIYLFFWLPEAVPGVISDI